MLPLQVRPLNVDGSLNLLGLETVRLIYFRNKMAGKNSQVYCGKKGNNMNCKNDTNNPQMFSIVFHQGEGFISGSCFQS